MKGDRSLTPEDRFWRFVVVTEECWLWTGHVDSYGYGQFSIKGIETLAHRFAYGLLVGPFQVGMELDHTCRNRRCVNPDHLEEVSHAENMRRGYWATKVTCRYGHPLTGANVYPKPAGGRACRTCNRPSERKKRQQRVGEYADV